DDHLKLGRAFCFLPLPVKTGFRVHINGYFEVSSNRRGIWYGDDMDRSGKIRSIWNRLLLEDVVAPSFAKLLLGMRQFWVQQKLIILYGLLVHLKNHGVSYLHDMEISGSKEISDVLVQLGMPIVPLPSDLFEMILNCKSDGHQKVVTPDSEQCEELSLFGDWPIIPAISGHLYRPSRQKKLLNLEKLSEKMQHVLVKIGCTILDSTYCIEHPDLINYVHDADAPGILDAIYDVSSSDGINQLLQCLEPNERDELRQFLLDPKWIEELETDVRDSIMLSILQELPQLCVEDASFREILRNLEFLPTISGTLKSPAKLYDPRNEELYALLEDSDSFPSGTFSKSGVLDMLQVNALKWLPDPLEDDQRKVNRMFLRAASAFKSRHFKSDLEKFWNELRLISWCPVLISPPHMSLPWPTVLSLVAPPKLVRPYSDLWLVSANIFYLDGLAWFDEMDIVKAVLEGCRWIWVGDGYATTKVVLNGPLHLAPYIRVIPADLAAFSDLFLELGIQEYLRPSDYANILYRMAIKKGTSPLDSGEIAGVYIYCSNLARLTFMKIKLIYIFQMYQADYIVQKLTSMPWLLESDGSENLFGSAAISLGAKQAVHKFVHGNISHDIAEKLGLRHILEMYADGPAVLFELVQNAEDAGASNVTFLLDKTHYGTSSLLSPEMGDWQGPALYCFNDSIFSPQDLYAISRIGQESKLEKPFAIGRFGLGFNCVYHFTDIQLLFLEKILSYFDPHACNLPGISPTHLDSD
ncbi:UNVERIFIED_CONTAM: Sacsin, partial [Sesamum radiatum]